MTFDEDLRQQQLAQEKIKTAEQRHQNIQFALIAFGIISFIVIFLLFSRSIVANEKLISFFGILGLLVVFEFINLLLHPWLSSIARESPVLMLLALVAIASLLIPFHHKMEHWIKKKWSRIIKQYVWRQRRRLLKSWKRIKMLQKNRCVASGYIVTTDFNPLNREE